MSTFVRVWSDRIAVRRPHLLRTAAIVLLTLVLAYYLGQQPSVRYIQIPLLLVGVWLLWRSPALGLVIMLVSASLLKLVLSTGTQTSLHLAFVLVPVMLGLWVVQMLARRSFHLTPSRTTLPAFGLVLVTTIALINGNLPLVVFAQQAPLRSQLGGWGIIVFSVGAFLLAANLLKDVRWLKLLVGVFLVFGATYFVGHIVPGAGGFVTRLFPIGANDSVFWLWFVALAAAQGLFNHGLDGRVRLLLGLLTVAALGFAYSPVQFNWASGWLPCTVALAVLVYLRWPRLGLMLGVFSILVMALGFETLQRVVLTEENQYSLLTRTAALQVISQIIRANPLLGVGPANYYWYAPLYSLLGFYVRFNSHNQYVDILAQIGGLGLAVYLWFALEAGRVGFQLRRIAQDGFARAYACASLAGLAGMLAAGMLGDWVLPFVYNVGIRGFRSSVIGWLFLGGLVSLHYLTARQAHPDSVPRPPSGPVAPRAEGSVAGPRAGRGRWGDAGDAAAPL
jgi:hypothetical protein